MLERLGGVGDHGGAELGHGLVMAGVADAGHDPGPGGGAQLDGGRADPAGGAVDQQPVAEAEAGLGEQGVVGGGDDLGEPAGLGPAKLVGDRDGRPLVDHGQLGLPAAADHGHDPVARAEAEDAGANGGDLAGQLQPGDVGRAARRGRVVAPDLVQVGAVDPGGRHPDQQLAPPRLRVGPLGHHQPPVGDRDRPHAAFSRPGLGSGLYRVRIQMVKRVSRAAARSASVAPTRPKVAARWRSVIQTRAAATWSGWARLVRPAAASRRIRAAVASTKPWTRLR